VLLQSHCDCAKATSQIVGTPRHAQPRSSLATARQDRQSSPDVIRNLQLVHRRVRHQRLTRGESIVGGVTLKEIIAPKSISLPVSLFTLIAKTSLYRGEPRTHRVGVGVWLDVSHPRRGAEVCVSLDRTVLTPVSISRSRFLRPLRRPCSPPQMGTFLIETISLDKKERVVYMLSTRKFLFP
jgi:hypothetical protein